MMKIVLSLVILFAPTGAQRTPRGRVPSVKNRHAGPEHAAVKPRVDEKTRAHQSPRSCDPLEWDAGFGTCDTYIPDTLNGSRCATDCNECGCASDICPECARILFDAGHGGCGTYAAGEENEDNCDAHCDDAFGCASDACPQCKTIGSVTLKSVKCIVPAGNIISNQCDSTYIYAASWLVIKLAFTGITAAGVCGATAGVGCAAAMAGAYAATGVLSGVAQDAYAPECDFGGGGITGSDELYITIGEDGENVWPGNNDHYVISAGETVYPEITVSGAHSFCLWEYDWFGGSWGDDLLGCFATDGYYPVGEIVVPIANGGDYSVWEIVIDVTE